MAASELFAKHGIDEDTTQQIANATEIATHFLYAKTKGERRLLVHNAHYTAALERGVGARRCPRVHRESTVLEAVVALLAPVVARSRVRLDNGRTYLPATVFGNCTEPIIARPSQSSGRRNRPQRTPRPACGTRRGRWHWPG